MTLSDNLRGILWMVFGMAGFAVLDTLLKILAGAIPTGQVMILQGIGGATVFFLMGLRAGARDWAKRAMHPAVVARNICEALAAVCFITALANAPLSLVAAIIQANPLLVTLGAAVFLREPVGIHRWSAIFVGLLGVLLVIRPWGAGFEPSSLWAVAGVIALSARDLLVRWVPRHYPTVQLGAMAMISLTLAGGALQLLPGATFDPMDGAQQIILVVSIFALAVGFIGTTNAMRSGDISAVTPFRYSRLPFAIGLAAIILNERPDALTLIGAGVIVASGLYTLWREQVRRRG
ncbi:DMT family transporter [Aliishimia ponticola]|uniref:DMT family transporter n=1 Tax=Aliishimia ponticola TaxID=2499833 RepID=A0A4S4NJB1_9RHOB|nr:DMT family transporter [Aliishimia ponticola]THH38837.1 DMT family transporter [Aliishimia ponticola]